jgi:hypothetical protein
MTPVTIVLVPYPVPVPVANGMGWERRRPPPPYPQEWRARWPVRQSIPVLTRETRPLLAQAKRIVNEQRARETLRGLER